MKTLGAVVLIFGLAIGSLSQAVDSNVFSNPTVGFEFTKPAGWHYLSAAQNLENIKKLKLSDAEFHAAMQKYSSAPLVAITKFPEPYDDVNPSFKVMIKPYGDLKGKKPDEIISFVIPQFESVFKDFEVVQKPVDTKVSGISSAYVRMNYNMEIPDGRMFPTTSELWIIPHGDYFFMIGAGTRQDEKNGSREDIQGILKTVRIEE
jgi:hypothetical protein